MQVSQWFRDLDLFRKMTEQSQKHQQDKERFCIQVSGKGKRLATAAPSLQEQMIRVPWNLCWMKARGVTQRLAKYPLAKTTKELFSLKHHKPTATQGGQHLLLWSQAGAKNKQDALIPHGGLYHTQSCQLHHDIQQFCCKEQSSTHSHTES